MAVSTVACQQHRSGSALHESDAAGQADRVTPPVGSFGHLSVSPIESDRVRDWIDRLGEMGVEGSSVGYAGGRGAFHELREQVMSHATREELEFMRQHSLPQARAMALSVVANPPYESPEPLIEHLCDRGLIVYRSRGCVGWTTTVGEFARDLLDNPAVLDSCGDCGSALLDAEELWSLDLGTLTHDDCRAVHHRATMGLAVRLQGLVPSLNWEGWRSHSADLEGWQSVKALGRAALQERDDTVKQHYRAFLLRVASAERVDAHARLTAASALTRVGNRNTLQQLEQHRDALDALHAGHPGEFVVRTLRRRLSFEQETEKLRQSTTWIENERLAGAALSAFKKFENEPFILDTLLSEGLSSFGKRSAEVHAAVAEAIGALLTRNTQGFAYWDIESDLGYALRAASVRGDWSDELRMRLSTAQLPTGAGED